MLHVRRAGGADRAGRPQHALLSELPRLIDNSDGTLKFQIYSNKYKFSYLVGLLINREDKMRITKQSSGGRGEYELCDYAPNGLRPSDLLEHILHIKLEDIIVDTGVVVTKAQGKYRLRLANRADQHTHFQIAFVLLLPKPVRDERIIGSGEPVLQNGAYIIKNLNFGEVTQVENDNRFKADLITVDAANRTVLAKQIPVLQRIQDIKHIWEHRDDLPPEISALIEKHRRIVLAGGPFKKADLKLVNELQVATESYSTDLEVVYSENTDAVPILLELTSQIKMLAPVSLEEIEPDNIELRKREVIRWQTYSRERGAASVRFRRKVREAYNWCCLICAARFPQTSINLIPGIDAAHILPWAVYALDEVYNGVALCKLHHWAFDERLLRIGFNEGDYFVELSQEARESLFLPEFSIDVLQKSVGIIPRHLLPENKSDWPKVELLDRFYSETP